MVCEQLDNMVPMHEPIRMLCGSNAEKGGTHPQTTRKRKTAGEVSSVGGPPKLPTNEVHRTPNQRFRRDHLRICPLSAPCRGGTLSRLRHSWDRRTS